MSNRPGAFVILLLVLGIQTQVCASTTSTNPATTNTSPAVVTSSSSSPAGSSSDSTATGSLLRSSELSTSQSHSVTTQAISSTTVRVCSTDYYCDLPVAGSSSKEILGACACPKTFLNIDNSCCLDQNWIIGLAAGLGALVITFLTLCIVGLMTREHKKLMKQKEYERGSKNPLFSNSDYTAELHQSNGKLEMSPDNLSEAQVLTTFSETPQQAEVQSEPSNAPNGDLNITHQLPVANPAPIAIITQPTHVVTNDNEDINSIDYDDVRLPNQNNEYHNNGYEFHPDPTMNDILRSDAAINFKPHLEHIDSTTNYNIRRPTVVKMN